MSELLSLGNIRKRFGGVVALAGVDFSLRAGEIHALCGENGAGKSTLIKILSGIHPAGSYEGEYRLAGRQVAFASFADAAAAGLSVIYQELALCSELTVAENIFLGHEPRRGLWGRGDGQPAILPLFIDRLRMEQESARLLATFGIALDPRSKVQSLGVGQKQLVEIAKALARRSQTRSSRLPIASPCCAMVAACCRGPRQSYRPPRSSAPCAVAPSRPCFRRGPPGASARPRHRRSPTVRRCFRCAA
jgi:D-xylose transport system ATP-binding protein